MRWDVLVVGLVGCWLAAIGPVPSCVAATTPAQVERLIPPEYVGWLETAEAWLHEEMLDRLTVPLGLAEMYNCPLGTGGELWIGTAPKWVSVPDLPSHGS